MNEYEPIKMMLRMAMERESIRHNEYISSMVRDAIVLRHHPEQIRMISRVTYKYSVVLGRSSKASFVEGLQPTRLSVTDIRQLLTFFESL